MAPFNDNIMAPFNKIMAPFNDNIMAPFNDNIMAPFNDIKSQLCNSNVDYLMFITFPISLRIRRFFNSFNHRSDENVTLSAMLPNINKFVT